MFRQQKARFLLYKRNKLNNANKAWNNTKLLEVTEVLM